MAKNLRSKLPSSDKLIIYDKNEDATRRFANETKGVDVAENVREVAEKSVCWTLHHNHSHQMMSIFPPTKYDLSWGALFVSPSHDIYYKSSQSSDDPSHHTPCQSIFVRGILD